MSIEYLEWDSNFFGKKIGKIIYSSKDLQKQLQKAKEDQYRLVYVFTPEKEFINEDIIKKELGKLIDRRVLYSQELFDSISLPEDILSETIEYNESFSLEEIENLAYISGRYSRFFRDDNFDKNDFFQLYKVWINKSIMKENADKVFIIKKDDKIEGFVTLKYGTKVGKIGLVAVSDQSQGRGYGRKLIERCIYDLLLKDIHRLEVPTQLDNKSACAFYEKCGFQIKNITNIYHFWL